MGMGDSAGIEWVLLGYIANNLCGWTILDDLNPGRLSSE